MNPVIYFLITYSIAIIFSLFIFVIVKLYKKYGLYVAVPVILEIVIIILIAILIHELMY